MRYVATVQISEKNKGRENGKDIPQRGESEGRRNGHGAGKNRENGNCVKPTEKRTRKAETTATDPTIQKKSRLIQKKSRLSAKEEALVA